MAKNKNDKSETAIKVGDEIGVVLANGEIADAKLTAINKDGSADIEFIHKGASVEITSSPLDPEAKLPDSWHPRKPVEAASTEPTPAGT